MRVSSLASDLRLSISSPFDKFVRAARINSVERSLPEARRTMRSLGKLRCAAEMTRWNNRLRL